MFQHADLSVVRPRNLHFFQGVDLNLDQFDLSTPERFASNAPSCSASLDSVEAGAAGLK